MQDEVRIADARIIFDVSPVLSIAVFDFEKMKIFCNRCISRRSQVINALDCNIDCYRNVFGFGADCKMRWQVGYHPRLLGCLYWFRFDLKREVLIAETQDGNRFSIEIESGQIHWEDWTKL
jgi:hypothetical protein